MSRSLMFMAGTLFGLAFGLLFKGLWDHDHNVIAVGAVMSVVVVVVVWLMDA